MDFILTAVVQGIGFCALGFGIYMSLRIFNIPDITTDGSYTLGGVITAVTLTSGMHPLLAMLLALFGGMCAGAITGIIHTRLKINALLAGILVMTALYSINLMIMGRSNLPLINITGLPGLLPLKNIFLSTIVTYIIFISLLLSSLTWLLRTDFGIAMRATGNSDTMAKSMGINTDRMKIIGLALANGFTALSGYLLTQYQGFADINMGIGIVISGLGSVMIGETLLRLFKTRSILIQLLAVIAGCIVFRLILALALSAGLDPNYLRLITALIVLIIVAGGNYKTLART